MIYELIALGDINRHIKYDIPTTTIQTREDGWKYLSELWNVLCLQRDGANAVNTLVQFIFTNKKSVIGRNHDSNLTRKSNVAHFIETMLEFCNLYVPTEIGVNALFSIYKRYDLFLLDDKTDSKFRAYSEDDNALFKIKLVRPKNAYMAPASYLDAMNFSSDTSYHAGYFEVMSHCINIMEASKATHPFQHFMPIFLINTDVVHAFATHNHMATSSAMVYHAPYMYAKAYVSAFMTIDMMHRNEQKNFKSSLLEIHDLWTALDAYTSDSQYISAFVTFFDAARCLIKAFYK